jgi:hypothetical protein
MKTTALHPSLTLRTILAFVVVVAALVMATPRAADAQLVVRIQKQPVAVVKAPRAPVAAVKSVRGQRHRPVVKEYRVLPGAHAKSVRTVVVTRCERRPVREAHHVWVAGHWQRTGPRTARWVEGHWERI